MIEKYKMLFHKHNLKVTGPRLKIYEFLVNNKDHQTSDEIYQALAPEMYTLSKATVYNTLHLLTEKGLIKALDFGEGQVRYDADTSEHMHFRCKTCGEIHEFDSSVDVQPLIDKNYDIDGIQIYIKGQCPNCK